MSALEKSAVAVCIALAVLVLAVLAASPVPAALAILAAPGALRLIKMPEVKSKTGLSDSKVYDEVAKGRLKPPVQLGSNSVAWVEAEVDEFILARIAERDAALVRAAANPGAEISRRPGRPRHSIWHAGQPDSEPKSIE
jgi:prophage regulatory protein